MDGGVYDIDFGNDDNVVEDNYGHDAMGYCAAVFAAEKQITTNSVIRGNLCIDNGRSPKLARRQGDLFISTWEDGSLDGVRIENNTFYWSPLIDVTCRNDGSCRLPGLTAKHRYRQQNFHGCVQTYSYK